MILLKLKPVHLQLNFDIETQLCGCFMLYICETFSLRMSQSQPGALEVLTLASVSLILVTSSGPLKSNKQFLGSKLLTKTDCLR